MKGCQLIQRRTFPHVLLGSLFNVASLCGYTFFLPCLSCCLSFLNLAYFSDSVQERDALSLERNGLVKELQHTQTALKDVEAALEARTKVMLMLTVLER